MGNYLMHWESVSGHSFDKVIIDVTKNRHGGRQSNVIWGEEGNVT